MTAEVAYTMKQLPSGRWSLDRCDVNHGIYDTLNLAMDAMHRLINPVVKRFDEHGFEIHNHTP